MASYVTVGSILTLMVTSRDEKVLVEFTKLMMHDFLLVCLRLQRKKWHRVFLIWHRGVTVQFVVVVWNPRKFAANAFATENDQFMLA
jgi:hypothetical protein